MSGKKDHVDWHGIVQDLFDKKLDVMSGYKIVYGEREKTTSMRLDYYCEADLSQPYDGPVKEGKRPLSHLKRFNYFEIKAYGDTMDEDLFWYYCGRALIKMRMGTVEERKGQMTLTIIVAHKPIKLLKETEYRFKEIEPWKYYSDWVSVLDINILVLPGMREVEGGEPMAYLQALEGNPKHRKLIWKKLLNMDMCHKGILKSVIMGIDEEDLMTIAEELRTEGEVKGEVKGQIRLLEKLVGEGQINRDYYEKTVAPLKKQIRKLEES